MTIELPFFLYEFLIIKKRNHIQNCLCVNEFMDLLRATAYGLYLPVRQREIRYLLGVNTGLKKIAFIDTLQAQFT